MPQTPLLTLIWASPISKVMITVFSSVIAVEATTPSILNFCTVMVAEETIEGRSLCSKFLWYFFLLVSSVAQSNFWFRTPPNMANGKTCQSLADFSPARSLLKVEPKLGHCRNNEDQNRYLEMFSSKLRPKTYAIVIFMCDLVNISHKPKGSRSYGWSSIRIIILSNHNLCHCHDLIDLVGPFKH